MLERNQLKPEKKNLSEIQRNRLSNLFRSAVELKAKIKGSYSYKKQ